MLDPEHPYLMKLELAVSYITSLSIKNLAIDEHKLPNVDDILHTVKRWEYCCSTLQSTIYHFTCF